MKESKSQLVFAKSQLERVRDRKSFQGATSEYKAAD